MALIEDQCWECSSHDVIHKDGEMICTECGGVFVE